MTLTFIVATVATLLTLWNVGMYYHWRDLAKRYAQWREYYERRHDRKPHPWSQGYLAGVRRAHDIFRKQFDRANRKDEGHRCGWRDRMFSAKQALEAELDNRGPKDVEP